MVRYVRQPFLTPPPSSPPRFARRSSLVARRRGTEQFLLPCVENLLVDVDGGVVEEALGCLEKFALMELVMGATLARLVEKYAALILHPASGVR